MYPGCKNVLVFLSLIMEIISNEAAQAKPLTAIDRFEIFEQMELHQHYIDNGPDLASAEKYVSLFWPDATFTVIDPDRRKTFRGSKGMKENYDYAHSVFPLYQWAHSMGAFEITGHDDLAHANWRWRVDWKANTTGVVSTGTYTDVFQRRKGIWKCLHRTSRDDPNWPLYLFWPYAQLANETYHPS